MQKMLSLFLGVWYGGDFLAPSPTGRGEKPSPPAPLPEGEGRSPHPQPLSQRARGDSPFSLREKGRG